MPFYNPHIAGIVPYLAKSYKLSIITFEDNLRQGKDWKAIPADFHTVRIRGISGMLSIIRKMNRNEIVGFCGVLYSPRYFLFCLGASLKAKTIQVFSEGFKNFRVRRSFLLSLLPWHKISLFGIGSNSVADYHKHLLLSKPRKNYHDFAYPYDLEFPDLRESPREYFSIFVGQLIQRKNVESFLDFAHSCIKVNSQLKFMIVGTGPNEIQLKQYCRELDLQGSVDWMGYTSRNEVLNLMSNANSLFLDSHYEGWGAVCLEATACGTYLLLGKNVRSRSLLETDDIGLIFEKRYLDKPQPLLKKIQNLTIVNRTQIQNHAKSYSSKSLSQIVFDDLRVL